MKVLQINSHYNQGGAARIATYIHRQLLAEGVESYVAYGRGKVWPEQNVYRFNRIWEVYLSAFLSRLTGINGWFNRGATRRLLRLIKQIQPDVVHMHAMHGYYINWPLLFGYLNKQDIPVVWTFHDCHAFVGNCGYYFECQRWRTGCGSCPNVQGYPKSQFFDFTAWMWKRKKELFTQGNNKVIVTPSDWLTGETRQSYFGKYKCVTIHNGIDSLNTFYPRDKQECRKKHGYLPEDKIVLGIAVGYSDPRKGAKYMLQLAKDLYKRDEEKSAKVILIGWDHANDEMLQGLTNVEALPAMESTETLAEYYSLADVFVLTSLAENYATVNLEAMACGTPVVGFDCGGTPEQLAGGKGIPVPTANQEVLSDTVWRVLNQEVSLLQGEELSRRIRTENSLEQMAKEYLCLYQELLNGRNDKI